MKKKIKVLALVALAAAFFVGLNDRKANAYTVDKTYAFSASQGDSRRTSNSYIIMHDVGAESGAEANARYFKNNWSTAQTYVAYVVGDGGKVFQVGSPGYVQWGALDANPYSPVQIELSHTTSKTQFKKDYKAYIDLARASAKKYGIPYTLDGSGKGIKTHLWVTNNYGGSHVDPYGYLARFGISKAQFAKDLKNGVSGTSTKTTNKTNSKKSNSYTAGGFFKGEKVRILGKATAYQTGQKISESVKKPTYTVKQVKTVKQSKSKQAVLLSGINSWVLAQDLAGYWNHAPIGVQAKTVVYTYKDKGRKQLVMKHKKGDKFVIKKIVKSGNYLVGLNSANHYMTLNKTNIAWLFDGTSAHKYYTVKKGDSFWKIAKSQKLSLSKLYSLNKANAKTLIKPGQRLVVK